MELNVYIILMKSLNKMSDPSSVKISFLFYSSEQYLTSSEPGT